MGFFQTKAKVLAVSKPTIKEVIRPGPKVTAILSIRAGFILASVKARSITGKILTIWFRAATSGTTPPYFLWILIWEETIFERILNLPALISTKAAAVSSQELSMPIIIILLFLLIIV